MLLQARSGRAWARRPLQAEAAEAAGTGSSAQPPAGRAVGARTGWKSVATSDEGGDEAEDAAP